MRKSIIVVDLHISLTNVRWLVSQWHESIIGIHMFVMLDLMLSNVEGDLKPRLSFILI